MIPTEQALLARFSSTYCCRNDASLTLVGDTSCIARLFGYTPEELSCLFRNSFLAIVTAEGREALRNSLTNGDDIQCVLPVCHKGGRIVWMLNRAVRHTATDGNTCIHGILVEISQLRQAYDLERKATLALKEKAQKDSLTQIYNASTARKLAEAYIAAGDACAALLIIDLDDFKRINDWYGHMFGDAVLVQTAKIIKNLFRSEDVVGRIGGEEFIVLMKGTADLDIIQNRCNKLNESLQSMFGDQVTDCKPSCSIGVALLPQHADSYFTLFCCADQALYYAKAHGKRQYALYDDSMAGSGYSLRHADYDENMLRGYIEF
jgi:diguanylate cyclase (GGDEF)-like protein